MGYALDQVAIVALLATREGANIERDTGWLALNAVSIPNGRPVFDASIIAKDVKSRSLGILSVGRIEPRKRQVDVAREAVQNGVKMTFIGGAPAGGSRYSNEFARIVEGSEGLLTWRRTMTHEAVLATMGDSRVLINASWVEVQSLVDIEAASCGCRVVVAEGGNSTEFLPRNVSEVAGGIAELLRATTLAESELTSPPPITDAWSWDDAVQRLEASYREIAIGNLS
ncbi:glycosyltransferase [Cryobacterium sp. HLT2-28]|uniref:glycosyltransferase n=1 Tax=Cryobacterium sp. HLT2-28 TaxID=1259146 RepID=UPI00106CAFD0|nr:glycosyltransferase [Cryobacterium sp. HLT2-28]TFB95887.1 glycosyltransferase family 1 protein [Cryobacterium sp. HLT2-28]